MGSRWQQIVARWVPASSLVVASGRPFSAEHGRDRLRSRAWGEIWSHNRSAEGGAGATYFRCLTIWCAFGICPASVCRCEVVAVAQAFSHSMLFNHRGISGPAILQISSFWHRATSTVGSPAADHASDWLKNGMRLSRRGAKNCARRVLANVWRNVM